MADRTHANEDFRPARRRPGLLYRTVAAVLMAAMGATVAHVTPAAAAHAPAASGGNAAVVNALKTIMGTPPANFRATMTSYLAQAQQAAKVAPDLDRKYGLSTYVRDAQTLLATGDQQVLNEMYFATTRTPNWQQNLQTIQKYTVPYHAALRWQAAHSGPHALPLVRVGTKNLGDDCPPSPGIIPVVVSNGLLAIAGIPYTLAPDSFTVVVLGEGATTPSPYKIVAAIIYIVVVIANQVLNSLYAVNNDCVGGEHTAQQDNMNTYLMDQVAVKTVDIKVTPIDTYHYTILTTENGSPVSASITGFTSIKITTGSTPTPVTISPSQVVPVPNATGLFVATLQPTQVGSSYEISVQSDDGASQGLTGAGEVYHYGSTVFSRTG